MQTLKHSVEKRLLTASRAIFLRKGFQKASMRDIARASGICLSNIYNYFPSKDALFCTIVRPAITTLEQMLRLHPDTTEPGDSQTLAANAPERIIRDCTALLSKHRTQLKLLFFCAQGSSLDDYKERVSRQYSTLLPQSPAGTDGKDTISGFYNRLHTAWMFALFEEIIRQKIQPKDYEPILRECLTGESWQATHSHSL